MHLLASSGVQARGQPRVQNAFAFQLARDAPKVGWYRAGSPIEPCPYKTRLPDGWGVFAVVSSLKRH
jgi:hypothetical protein